jgi:hypothetical protein
MRQLARADVMLAASREALASGNSMVYTVWWVRGYGWYDMLTNLAKFTELTG